MSRNICLKKNTYMQASFLNLLTERLAGDGFSTEDVLLAFLPLARETLRAHEVGFVAPLEGVDRLHFESGKIWFAEADRKPWSDASRLVNQIQRTAEAGVEILSEIRLNTETSDGSEQLLDISVGRRGEEIRRPVYLSGYVVWEHEIGHHDPLTDVFSLGMILASLAIGLDFTEPNHLQRFVKHRRNLFALRSDLHPVIAQAVFRMTELDRRRRVQDLNAVIGNLEHYRDQEIDFEFDLARIQGFNTQNRRDKSGTILIRLQHRLFDISKRNRLLHFKPTLQTVNLTHASIPISFDIKKIPKDRILIWNNDFQKSIVKSMESGKPISLNKYLNFQEALYLPPTLDRIIAEVRRDEAEFGFAQLRLAACFLHWADLKQKPAPHYDSPLVLIPVSLKKKKGIRDTYLLEIQTTNVEINPVLRHLFKQLYGIELPDSIDLTKTTLDEFFDFLQKRIATSEPAVTLSKLDVPRIELIHDKAKRHLDQYAKRARLAGRGVRHFLDIDYSYDPTNYHPLGIRLFVAKVQPPVAHLQRLTSEHPLSAPRTSYYLDTPKELPKELEIDQPEPAKPKDEKTPVAEIEKSFFAVRNASEENPYQWNFDFCGVTLSNFRYQKMSLVRDYESLLGDMPDNPAFEATFSLAPREVPAKPEILPIQERFDVVPCDPTQAESIARSRTLRSYIIQGPPGTGKSQTITNLIADYIARGKRVLFVCEKRAAIDVVFARLRQTGLDDLCCLIHDSQADKKSFVMNLKETYEAVLAESENSFKDDQRMSVLRKLEKEIVPLDAFDRLMQCSISDNFSVRNLLACSIRLAPNRPELNALEVERLPEYGDWLSHAERLDALAQRIGELQSGSFGVFSSHPLRRLSVRLTDTEHPIETVTKTLANARDFLSELLKKLEKCGVPSEHRNTFEKISALLEYVQKVARFADSGHLPLLNAKNEYSKSFVRAMRKIAKLESEYQDAASQNTGWFDNQKFSPEETRIALEQSRLFEQSIFSWLNPARWRLRSLLLKSYNFASHRVRPAYSAILAALDAEHKAAEQLEKAVKDIGVEFGIHGDIKEFTSHLWATINGLSGLTPSVAWVHAALMQSDSEKAKKIVRKIFDMKNSFESLQAKLATILDLPPSTHPDDLKTELSGMEDALDDLPRILECLAEMKDLPQTFCELIRSVPLTLESMESATATRTVERIIQNDKIVRKFGGQQRRYQAEKLEQLYDAWLSDNAAEIRHRIHRRFLENVRCANSNVADSVFDPTDPRLTRTWKLRYNRGRRELEHEFGKTMRYRSIRDLVSGETGQVVRDLKPVWLMSPLSVSDTLPLETDCFDVVIFDEASQITLEEAVPPLFRATQAIVVGDEKQLPPTDFFSSKKGDAENSEDEESMLDDEGMAVSYDLDSNSFLNHAAKNLGATMLGWHYRSRSESLISFSNAAFYEGRLLTVPDVRMMTENHSDDAPLRFVYLPNGVYDKRRNKDEAEKIAELTRELLNDEKKPTIGIIAFSEAQQDEIETALEHLAQKDQKFSEQLEAERNREEDGQFVGLLVKNLENIQGDERDVIILSICYGYNPLGKMLMNFGPINKSGGERRLNVAFSRAKWKMIVVSSIRPDAITNDYNQGAACLKNYLRYAEALSNGQTDMARSILHAASGHLGFDRHKKAETQEPFAEQLCESLRQHGLVVDRNIGHSEFRCDLAVRREGETTYCLGILIDNENYYGQTASVQKTEERVGVLLGREMMRPRLLRAFDWNIAIVLAKDWFESPESVLKDLLQLIKMY
ncbi:MAG: DUF4011 domain-containing protein [Planctomycetaceae bacterium]|jgi:hypothetical protein|nr:DUF4011 domain-containing protein [Planctomycetaceae bacterium]